LQHIPAPFKSYPGGKSGEQVYQTIINEIPPIKVLVSLFAGNAGVERRIDMKGGLLVLNDLDLEVFKRYQSIGTAFTVSSLSVYNSDGLDMLQRYIDNLTAKPNQTLIFADPPYLFESRSSQRAIYNHEWDYETHVRFLLLAKKASDAGYKLAITHPTHILYENHLQGWRAVCFESMTRSGKKIRDTLWLNYEQPAQLQDYRYWGNDYRERENFRRRVSRNVKKIFAMPEIERNCLIEELIKKRKGK